MNNDSSYLGHPPQDLKKLFESLEKQEIPVKSWAQIHTTAISHGPHFRVGFLPDGKCLFRSAWDQAEDGTIIQRDYLLGKIAADALKHKIMYFQEIPV